MHMSINENYVHPYMITHCLKQYNRIICIYVWNVSLKYVMICKNIATRVILYIYICILKHIIKVYICFIYYSIY